jgi:hypothetical protein
MGRREVGYLRLTLTFVATVAVATIASAATGGFSARDNTPGQAVSAPVKLATDCPKKRVCVGSVCKDVSVPCAPRTTGSGAIRG